MDRNIKEIISHFNIKGEYQDFEKVITGHINDSYLIRTSMQEHPGYFLQWINNYIFKDVEGLMNNISVVTQHLSEKRSSQENHSCKVLNIIPTTQGNNYFVDAEGEYWRLYSFIGGTHVYDVVENTEIAFEGGKAFGIFISLLADLPADRLTETIPDFHNMEMRMESFYNSVRIDPADRVKQITAEIEFVKQRAEEMMSIPALIKTGELPIRITHNDTKFNNILFDKNEQAICIVDLDTVMPGSILFDFGDAIRTGANTASEDEKDLSKVDINLPIYKAYTQGFIKSTRHTLTSVEIENLSFSARFMTFIIGLRFLTDFVDGDPYFRTLYANHNLDRARVQFRLLEAMERSAGEMHGIVLASLQNNNA